MSLFKKNKAANDTIEQVSEEQQYQPDESTDESTDAELDTEENDTNAEEEDDILEERAFNDTGFNSEDKSIDELVDQVLEYFTVAEPQQLRLLEAKKISKENFTEQVKQYIKKEITRDKDRAAAIFDKFSRFIWSYDILDDLIDDDDISDIKCYSADHIRIKRLGHRENADVKFISEKHYAKFVEHVAIKNKINISDQNAAQKFVDKESSPKAILRFNITTPFINSNDNYVLHIRKIPKIKKTEQELLDLGFFGENGEENVKYFKDRIKSGGGILLAGKGGAGKTTFINWLIDLIPDDKSGVVIQDLEEIFSDHPDMDFKHAVHSRGEGKIQYTLCDLSTNALLTDIDYFIIGEIKSDEAVWLVNAVYTGAFGIASVHGASSQEALSKLIHYIMTSEDGKKFDKEELLNMLKHLDTIVFMQDFHVAEVSEVVGYDEEKKDLIYKKVI